MYQGKYSVLLLSPYPVLISEPLCDDFFSISFPFDFMEWFEECVC